MTTLARRLGRWARAAARPGCCCAALVATMAVATAVAAGPARAAAHAERVTKVVAGAPVDQPANLAANPSANPTADSSREAFSHPRAGLSDAQREVFLQGRSLFRRAWISGARSEGEGRGLGPLYNRLSCVACHPGNGRGQAPDAPDQRMQSMLVRLSVPGHGMHGAPRPHPVYGDQLQEEGVPGVPGEGRASLRWLPVPHTEANGRQTLLRRPVLAFDELGYGPLPGVLSSPRVGPAVYGLGLLQQVPDAALRQLASQRQADGFRGRLNLVWDPVAQRQAIGRFGWKANAASVEAQVVQAALGDLGLSSAAMLGPGCSQRQSACLALATSQGRDLSEPEVAALTAYMSDLAPPAPRQRAEPASVADRNNSAHTAEPEAAAVNANNANNANNAHDIARGRSLFNQARCSACHRPSLPQRGGAPAIAPYTDLLLHDLGAGLADGRPDYRASGREWRTAPLWGAGLVPVVNEHSQYLHDGRARNLHEAVLWHDGQARRARLRYERLSADDQATLLAFVAAL